MMTKVRWGLLAGGAIARAFAKGVQGSETGVLQAIACRDLERARAFAKEFKIPEAAGGYAALLENPNVDAVYISTPHPMHAEWAIRAARAGKHVLCEKPVTLHAGEAEAVIEAARRNGVFFMEAFMYRCHPQTEKLVELIREGVIGEVRLIQSTFSFHAGYNLESRLLNPELGGGGILDVGGYTTSMAKLVAAAALGRESVEPLRVVGAGRIGRESGVDEYAAATLLFPCEILAQCATGVQLGLENDVKVFGSEGSLVVPMPWHCSGHEGGVSTLIVRRHGEKPREAKIKAPRGLYAYEADAVGRNLVHGQAPFPAMTPQDTLENMRILDRWREACGMQYPGERPQPGSVTVTGELLRRGDCPPVPSDRIPGLDKDVSRLVMGCDNETDLRYCSVLWDDFFEMGGNAFDTAWLYGGGAHERTLGEWVRVRGVRDHVVILDKGGHTPHCYPESILRQFDESLERLQTDYLDIYCMHRDNSDVPVGEFVDALNRLHAAGRVRVFGGSNWSPERIDAANAYAEQNGLEGFRVVSNNFSLARMVNPPWGGCVSVSDPDSMAWLAERKLALLPWSSQAQGFFVPGRAHPEKREDANFVRSWYSEDNFERQRRCRELAVKRGVDAVNVPLAYVLSQPFPVFALIGPRRMAELHSCVQALGIELSSEEVNWLQHG